MTGVGVPFGAVALAVASFLLTSRCEASRGAPGDVRRTDGESTVSTGRAFPGRFIPPLKRLARAPHPLRTEG